MKPIGIIDIGSNSIKSLVVGEAGNRLIALNDGRSPTRIGTGLSDHPPCIRNADILAAAGAINQLIAEATQSKTPTSPAFSLYATSAIREASNRDQVVAELSGLCHAPLTVLSGEEEATLIGWAVRSMPELAAADDLLVADLGGGSLELLQLQNGRIRQKCSLHLGAVRLTTEHFGGGIQPVSTQQQNALAARVDAMLASSGFDFSVAESAVLVGSGGALSALHHMDCFAPCEQHSDALGSIPLMPVEAMEALYHSACQQDAQTRASVSGFPKNRADIMPAALLVLLRLAALCRASAYAYCSHNLRFGLAAFEVHKLRSATAWTPADRVPAITIHA